MNRTRIPPLRNTPDSPHRSLTTGRRAPRFLASRGSGSSDLTFAVWTDGSQSAAPGPVLVSVTDFLIPSARDRIGAWARGPDMRRLCASMPGALGFWLWVKPLRRRSGSVSIWRGEDELRRFVAWPSHVEIMRRYRDAGEVTATTWWAERFDAAQIWTTAEPRRSGHDPELGHPRAAR
jgi:hypothetical protein